MSFRKPTSLKDFLVHLAVLLGASILIVVIVFYVWLPITTNHGETITVPNIREMTIDELDDFLDKRNLRYKVTADSSYSSSYPPLTVLRQVPKPNTKVKENHRIYVTLNSESPPKVRMPKVEDLSLKRAMIVLKSYDLKLGEVKFIPDIFFGVIHEAKMNDRTVLEGERIEKGSVIDLVAGDGHGNTQFQSPNLIGLDQEEAEVAIIGSGLKIGKVEFLAGFTADNPNSNDTLIYREIAPSTVQQQHPFPGEKVKIGDPVDIWIYNPDSVSNTATILDDQ